ncbi:DUF1998 domain-containing protein [Zhihengliuella somnathii]
MSTNNHVVGQVRPSQLLWAYGPGSIVDLPNLSVVTMGLNKWDPNRCPPVEEARLLSEVKRVLGPHVQWLRIPPFLQEDRPDPFSAEGRVGVPVSPFPRWLRCIKCGLLAEYDSGLFDIKSFPYRPERTHFLHTNCDKGKHADAVPARFLLACRNGHLDDFPWNWFIHGGSDCKGTFRFFERGASLQTENLWVKCDTCDKARSLVHAFGKDAADNLPGCRGRHPHLDSYEDCTQEPRTLLLGATNSWFPVTLSVLAIPLEKNQLSQLVLDGWEHFADVEDEAELKGIVKTLIRTSALPGIDKWDVPSIWQAIEHRKAGKGIEVVSEGDIKGPEWEVLTSSSPPSDWPHFMSTTVNPPVGYEAQVERVLLLERLREVNALIGYTRVEAPEETSDPDERPPMAALTRGTTEWVPASEVHGEGIFIEFNESVIKSWEQNAHVADRDKTLFVGHQGWRNARHLKPDVGFPPSRYTMLHTLAHLLVRELALECGYNAASIRERVYASSDPEAPMAGILLYTAAADSDGTLGGLVDLGKPDFLGRLLDQAVERASICSSDPLCSEHDPSKDRSLHAAACHSCTFVSETSCERGNRYLDRAFVIPTLRDEQACLFHDGSA